MDEEILRYLNGQMDEENLRRFEQRIANDENLKEEVEHSKRVYSILNEDTLAFAAEVKEVVESNRKKRTFSPLWIAASISIIVVAVVYLWTLQSKTTEELADKYLQAYPDVLTRRATDSIIDMDPYNRRDFQEAITVFSNSIEKENSVLVRLYLGISYLMIEKYDDALKVWDNTDYLGSQFEYDFLWYKGLTHLKQNQTNKAKGVFEKLSQHSEFYRERSLEILENLD